MHSRRLLSIATVALLAVALSGCLSVAGSTDQVQAAGSTEVDGWHYDFFRNLSYPCSISGYQTFAIGTKIGSSNTATKPLWVKMRGGGYGYFDDAGTPQPSAGLMKEESLATLLSFDTPGLMATVKAGPEGFRVLLV